MNITSNITESEKVIINLIKNSELENDGQSYEYAINLAFYSNFSVLEVKKLISSLKEKNMIKSMYDYNGTEVFLNN